MACCTNRMFYRLLRWKHLTWIRDTMISSTAGELHSLFALCSLPHCDPYFTYFHSLFIVQFSQNPRSRSDSFEKITHINESGGMSGANIDSDNNTKGTLSLSTSGHYLAFLCDYLLLIITFEVGLDFSIDYIWMIMIYKHCTLFSLSIYMNIEWISNRIKGLIWSYILNQFLHRIIEILRNYQS